MQILTVKVDSERMVILVTAKMDDGAEITFEVSSKADLDNQLVRYEQFQSDCASLKALEGKSGKREKVLKDTAAVLDEPL